MARVRDKVREVYMVRAERYNRLAIAAREDESLVTMGYALATIFMVLGVLDAVSTNWALSVGAYEANGLMRKVQHYLGDFWFAPKMLLQGLVASMIIWSPNRPTIIIMTIMSCWTATIVANNFLIAYALS